MELKCITFIRFSQAHNAHTVVVLQPNRLGNAGFIVRFAHFTTVSNLMVHSILITGNEDKMKSYVITRLETLPSIP